ncbi:MAG: hypothetical protein QM759_11530 [Terricaulis sp.]
MTNAMSRLEMSRTEISFVVGLDPVSPVLPPMRAAGFAHRFAVVQHTSRPGAADMYFDAHLWRALLAFAEGLGADGGVVTIAQGKRELAVAEFLRAWDAEDAAERGPPDAIVVRRDDAMIAYIATEPWVNVGGPAPYHDSYTYAVFTHEDIGARLMAFLAARADAAGWDLADEVMTAPVRKPRSLLQKLFE